MPNRAIIRAVAPALLGAALISITPASRGQILALANPSSATVTVFDGEVTQPVAVFNGIFGSRYLACDGVDTVWVSRNDADALARLDVPSLGVAPVPLGGRAEGVALTPDGGLVVSVLGDRLERLDPAGGLLWSRTTPPAPRQLVVDRNGRIWVVHYQSVLSGMLVSYEADGTLRSQHPLGVLPRSLFADRFGSIWVLCIGSGDLYRYRDTGDLVAVLDVAGATSATADRNGALYLTYPTSRELEFRDRHGSAPVRVPVADAATEIYADVSHGIWTTTFETGAVRHYGPYLSHPTVASYGIGLHTIGDPNAMLWAGAGGAARDADGDGVPNGHELEAGSHPFDPTSSPMAITPLAPLVPGAEVDVEVVSRGTPGEIYWLGLSHAPGAYGAGPFGFSLAAGPLFDLFQASYQTFIDHPLGALDWTGRDVRRVRVPAMPGLSGLRVYAAFQTVSLHGFRRLPSPAFVLDIL